MKILSKIQIIREEGAGTLKVRDDNSAMKCCLLHITQPPESHPCGNVHRTYTHKHVSACMHTQTCVHLYIHAHKHTCTHIYKG